MWVAVEEEIIIGENTLIKSSSDLYAVAFEDNQDTGYFYAIKDIISWEILDALHVYNVTDLNPIEKKALLKIIWSEDLTMAALVLNDYCHAIFDFHNQKGYCINGFPEPKKWQQDNRKLTQSIEDVFINK